MNSTSSKVLLSSSIGKEKSVLWLGTYFYTFKPHSILNMNDNTVCTCPDIKPPYVDLELEFKFIRISELEFRVTCTQRHVIPIPGKYSLEFECSINIFDEDPQVFQMQSDEFEVFEAFYLDANYREYFSSNDLNKEIELMILIKMIEYDCASNEARFNQQRGLYKMIKPFFNYKTVLHDLCFMLDDIPRLQDVFTGRQNSDFAEAKSMYIARAASFSEEIVSYMKSKDDCVPVPLIDLGLILGFIFKAEQVPIKDREIIDLYYDAHSLGLNFLVNLIRDVIIGRLTNVNFLMDTVQAAHRVNDEILFDKLSKYYHDFQKELEDPDGYFEKLKNIIIEFRFIVRSLERQLKKFESAGGVETNGSANSSPKIIVSLK